jgi:hypothetical protein
MVDARAPQGALGRFPLVLATAGGAPARGARRRECLSKDLTQATFVQALTDPDLDVPTTIDPPLQAAVHA